MMEITVAVVGKTGFGKSSLGNALLGAKHFSVGVAAEPETQQCSSATARVQGMQLTVIDTPDALIMTDTNTIKEEASRFIQLCHSGLHAFLLVVECGRFTQESREAVDAMAAMFGDCVYDFLIVVFSRGDNFDSDEQFMKDIAETRRSNPDLNSVLQRCNNRVARIDNGRRCDKKLQQRQVQHVLSLVQQLVKQNNKTYTQQMFGQAQEKLIQSLRSKDEQRLWEEQRQERIAQMEQQKLQLEEQHRRQLAEARQQQVQGADGGDKERENSIAELKRLHEERIERIRKERDQLEAALQVERDQKMVSMKINIPRCRPL